MSNIRSHARKSTNGLYAPPIAILNVLAHLNITIREIKRALSLVPEEDEELRFILLDQQQKLTIERERLGSLYDLQS